MGTSGGSVGARNGACFMMGGDPEAAAVPDVLECWSKGAVLRSRLIRLMADGCREPGGLDTISTHVDDTGEVNWLVEDAMRMDVPIPARRASARTAASARSPSRRRGGRPLWATLSGTRGVPGLRLP